MLAKIRRKKRTKVDADRHADNNRQHFTRIKYKSLLPLHKQSTRIWSVSSVRGCRIFDRLLQSHYTALVVQTRRFPNCVCVNGTNCIGCIQLYYIRIEIAGLKFNLSFQTNYLFLRRKLFRSFMYFPMRGYRKRDTYHDTVWVATLASVLFSLFSSSSFSLFLCLLLTPNSDSCER